MSHEETKATVLCSEASESEESEVDGANEEEEECVDSDDDNQSPEEDQSTDHNDSTIIEWTPSLEAFEFFILRAFHHNHGHRADAAMLLDRLEGTVFANDIIKSFLSCPFL